MRILVTGSAGFIGSALTLRLLERGDEVVGIDNHNNYYDPKLKKSRIKIKAKLILPRFIFFFSCIFIIFRIVSVCCPCLVR